MRPAHDSSGSETAMLGTIKELFERAARRAEGDAIAGWARRAGHVYKREQDGDGFAIDGKFDAAPWRLEWGRPQRPYIEGHELRAANGARRTTRPADAAHDQAASRAARERSLPAGRPRATRPSSTRTSARGDALAGRCSRRSRSPARRSCATAMRASRASRTKAPGGWRARSGTRSSARRRRGATPSRRSCS